MLILIKFNIKISFYKFNKRENMCTYLNKYGYLIGFFLGYLDVLESDQDILNYFKNNVNEIPICIDEISKLLSDNLLDWKKFIDEANMYFSSEVDFIYFFNWLKSELTQINSEHPI